LIISLERENIIDSLNPSRSGRSFQHRLLAVVGKYGYKSQPLPVWEVISTMALDLTKSISGMSQPLPVREVISTQDWIILDKRRSVSTPPGQGGHFNTPLFSALMQSGFQRRFPRTYPDPNQKRGQKKEVRGNVVNSLIFNHLHNYRLKALQHNDLCPIPAPVGAGHSS